MLSVSIIHQRVLPLLLCLHSILMPARFRQGFKVLYLALNELLYLVAAYRRLLLLLLVHLCHLLHQVLNVCLGVPPLKVFDHMCHLLFIVLIFQHGVPISLSERHLLPVV